MPSRRDRHEQWAVFWCSLLSPLLYGEIPETEAGTFLRQLSETECEFPDGRRRRPSRATLYRKWKEHRQGGLEGLERKPRSDRGQPRKDRAALVARAIALKQDQSRRSSRTINQFLQREFHNKIPRSTLYRQLQRAGATRRKLGISSKKIRSRWTREASNDLWLGDFQDGPYVLENDRAVESHLSAFIDCHSRYVVEARYYLRENFDILIDSLLRAWGGHGAPRELYLDNAKIYHAQGLRRACCSLNIRLLHRPVRDAAPGGLIERFFRTAQDQFEAEVRAGEILTLDRLNRGLTAWLATSYHEEVHSEIRQSPRLRYEQDRKLVRYVDLHRVSQYFLRREPRTVDRTYSDIRLNGGFFRVDPKLRGDAVEVRYDPFRALETVLVYSPEGEYLGVGQRHDRERRADQPQATPPSRPVKFSYLALLEQIHEESLRRRQGGIDYQAVLAQGHARWPFVEFVVQLAAHLGLAGGLSAFRADDLTILQQVHARLPGLDSRLLRQACEEVPQRSIPEIVFRLQQLHDQRRP